MRSVGFVPSLPPRVFPLRADVSSPSCASLIDHIGRSATALATKEAALRWDGKAA
jgi:hypothetical protein